MDAQVFANVLEPRLVAVGELAETLTNHQVRADVRSLRKLGRNVLDDFVVKLGLTALGKFSRHPPALFQRPGDVLSAIWIEGDRRTFLKGDAFDVAARLVVDFRYEGF